MHFVAFPLYFQAAPPAAEPPVVLPPPRAPRRAPPAPSHAVRTIPRWGWNRTQADRPPITIWDPLAMEFLAQWSLPDWHIGSGISLAGVECILQGWACQLEEMDQQLQISEALGEPGSQAVRPRPYNRSYVFVNTILSR